jgi:hypothetical protein
MALDLKLAKCLALLKFRGTYMTRSPFSCTLSLPLADCSSANDLNVSVVAVYELSASMLLLSCKSDFSTDHGVWSQSRSSRLLCLVRRL